MQWQILGEKHEKDKLEQKLEYERKIREQRESEANMMMTGMKDQMVEMNRIHAKEREEDEKRRTREQGEFERRIHDQFESFTKRVEDERKISREELAKANEKATTAEEEVIRLKSRGLWDRLRNN